MVRVLGRANSINVQKVMWLAAEIGLDVERVDVGGAFGGNDTADYLAKNPKGRVTVLADGDYLLPIVEESGGEFAIVGDPVYIGGGVGMGIRETDGDLKAAMDAAIAEMKASGELNALITEWFGPEGAVY